MQIFTSRLILPVYFLFLAALSLTGWGLYQSSSASKEIDKNNSALQQQLKSSQQNLTFSSGQAETAPSSSMPSKNTPANDSPKTSGNTSSTLSPAVTDQAKEQASNDIYYIRGQVESYWADNGYYPGDVNYSTYAALNASQSYFVPPTGVHFVYSPTPNGCSTAAHNCTGYTALGGYDSGGNAVTPVLKSLN